MELGALTIFATVAHGQSITGAAQQLGYSPSNITARIQQLEAELGTALFYRRSRGVALTPTGRILLPYATQVLRLLDEARVAVQDQGRPHGPLLLGAMETTAAVRLPTILAAYHQAHPQVDLTLSTGTSEELIDAVVAYRLDGAFVAGPVAHPELIPEVAFHEELLWVGGPNQSITERPPQATILVFRRGCSYRARLEQLLRERGNVPFRVMEFGSLDAILGCVAAGMGMSLLPRSVIEQVGQKRLQTLDSQLYPPITIPTMFIRRSNTLRTQAMQAFMELIQTTR
jgi:DNA-binding transcriptional LysR family regulator